MAPWIIALIVFVVLGAGIGLYFLIDHLTNSSDATATADSETLTKDSLAIRFVADNTRDVSARKSSRHSNRSVAEGAQFGGDPNRTTLDIQSLQYYLSSIRFAEDLELNGSAFNNPTNSVTLFNNELGDVSMYESYGFDEAEADTSNYVDLLDETDVEAKINQTLESVTPGTYNYMMINWAQPFKIRATAYDASGTAVLSTKSATSNEEITDSGGGGEYTYYRTTTGDMTTSPSESELTTVVFNNGGAFLKLATPLTITAGGGPYRLYLVYDPYQSIRAAQIGGVGKLAQVVDANDAWFSASLMNMAAVLAEQGDTIRRSRIRIVRTDTEDENEQYDYLLQVYTLDRTPDVISAVNVGIVAKDGDTLLPAGAPQTATSLNEIALTDESTSSSTYNFLVWNGDAFITGLDVSSTTGGTVTMYELAGSPQGANVTESMTWSYIGEPNETFITAK